MIIEQPKYEMTEFKSYLECQLDKIIASKVRHAQKLEFLKPENADEKVMLLYRNLIQQVQDTAVVFNRKEYQERLGDMEVNADGLTIVASFFGVSFWLDLVVSHYAPNEDEPINTSELTLYLMDKKVHPFILEQDHIQERHTYKFSVSDQLEPVWMDMGGKIATNNEIIEIAFSWFLRHLEENNKLAIG